MTQRLLHIVGILGGLMWIALPFFAPEFGEPGTAAYERYELWNRLWTPALLGIFLGLIGYFNSMQHKPNGIAAFFKNGILLGLLLMIIGNIAEFWVYTDLPYNAGVASGGRNVAWMTFFIGFLFMSLMSLLFGRMLLRDELFPKWLGFSFMLPLLLTIPLSFVNFSYGFTPIGITCVLLSAYSLRTPSEVSRG
jgi:hypothetical protein